MHVTIDSPLSSSYFDSFTSFTIDDYTGYGDPAFIACVKKYRDIILNENAPGAVILKKKANIVYTVSFPEETGFPFQSIVVKKCLPRNVIMRLLQPLKKSKARRSFETARYLIEHNLGTPQPLGYLEKRRGNLVLASYFVTENVEPCLKINQYLYYHSDNTEDINSLMHAVAEYITRMHASGLRHRDCNLTNFLLSPSGEGQRLVMIDLNRARIKRRLSAFTRVNDIGRLYWKQYRPAFFKLFCEKNTNVARWEWFFNFYYWWRKKRRKIKRQINK